MQHHHVMADYGEHWDIEPVPDTTVPLELAWYAAIGKPMMVSSGPTFAVGRYPWGRGLLKLALLLSLTSIAIAAGRLMSPPVVLKTAANNPEATRAPWRMPDVATRPVASAQSTPMSAWRRAYISRHGHEPAAAAPAPKSRLRLPHLALASKWRRAPMTAWRRAYIAKHGHQPPRR